MNNKFKIDLSLLKPMKNTIGDDEIDTKLLQEYAIEAKKYLLEKSWCNKIEKGYFGFGIGYIIAIFLFEITPSTENIDNFIWIIVGDLPPAYLSPVYCKNPAETLDGYITEMNFWVEAVLSGKSIDDLIPVNVEPTIENAQKLKKRLDFLRKNIYTQMKINDI